MIKSELLVRVSAKNIKYKLDRETSYNLVKTILEEEEKTILPRYYEYREKELTDRLKADGINAEVFVGREDSGLFLRRV